MFSVHVLGTLLLADSKSVFREGLVLTYLPFYILRSQHFEYLLSSTSVAYFWTVKMKVWLHAGV